MTITKGLLENNSLLTQLLELLKRRRWCLKCWERQFKVLLRSGPTRAIV